MIAQTSEVWETSEVLHSSLKSLQICSHIIGQGSGYNVFLHKGAIFIGRAEMFCHEFTVNQHAFSFSYLFEVIGVYPVFGEIHQSIFDRIRMEVNA